MTCCKIPILFAGQAAGLLSLVTLNADKYPTAVCTDGSRAGYYWRPAASQDASHLWLVYLQGGGWCYDAASCASRCGNDPSNSTKSLCSSSVWPSTLDVEGVFWPGTEDMQLRDANKVYIKYCTSDGHMGDAGASPYTGGRHFRGNSVVRAVLNELVVTHSLGATSTRHLVTFGGGSAGGRGAMVHLDYVPSMLGSAAANVDVVGLLDSPLWIDMPTFTGKVSLADTTRGVHSWANVTHLGEECMAKYNSTEQWRCMFAQYRMPTMVRTPYFLVASQYDSFQLSWNVGYKPTTQAELAYAATFANKTQSLVLSLRNNWQGTRPNAVFSWACWSHAVSTKDAGYNIYKVNGSTMRDAFMTERSWTAVSATQWVDQCSGFACGPGCSGW